MTMTDSRVTWAGKLLPVFLDELEDEAPLHWREVQIDTHPTHSAAAVYVCDAGHVHCAIGMDVPNAMSVLAGLFAYTIALAYDGQEDAMHTITKQRMRDTCKLVRRILHQVCSDTAEGYAMNIGLVRGWFDHGGVQANRVLLINGPASDGEASVTSEAMSDDELRPTLVDPFEDVPAIPVGWLGNVTKGSA